MAKNQHKPLKGLTFANQLLIGLSMPGMAMLMACMVFQVSTGQRLDTEAEELTLPSVIYAFAALYGILSWWLAGIVSLVWTYGAARNASALRPDADLKPGWAVGWYFVPFALLFKPFEYLKKIWNISLGARIEATTPPILLIWWLVHVFGGILLRIGERAEETSIANGHFFDLALQSAALALILCSMGLFFWISRQIGARLATPVTDTSVF